MDAFGHPDSDGKVNPAIPMDRGQGKRRVPPEAEARLPGKKAVYSGKTMICIFSLAGGTLQIARRGEATCRTRAA